MAVPLIRAGVIRNLKSHRNRKWVPASVPRGVLEATPHEPEELRHILAGFAASGVELVVIDGGDGTVRDVLSRLPESYVERPPSFAVVPSGKTNALALDLGLQTDAGLETLLAAAEAGRTKKRACLEIVRSGREEAVLRGFLFGLGAFVRGTELAHRSHRLGFFDNAAVAATIAGAAARTLAGGPGDPWRQGEAATLALGETPAVAGAWFIVLAATLKRFPLGLQPFGRPREGLKVLTVQAPPRQLWAALPKVLRGGESPWLEKAGYRRADVDSLRLSWSGDFVLDGEIYRGGDLTVRRGPRLEFVVP